MFYSLKFWGVRGSIASSSSVVGSHTSCVELQAEDGESFFFDAGTGIRVATATRGLRKLRIFLSHFHWDHIQGLPFIEGLGDRDMKIEIWCAYPDTLDRLKHLFDERFHPVPFERYADQIEIKNLEPGRVYEYRDLQVETAPLSHPGQSFALRLKGSHGALVYATDSDYDPLPPETSKILVGSTYAITDSQYLVGDSIKKADYGHASFKTALDVCAAHQIKECFLYHLDPNYSDDQLHELERQAREYVQQTYGPQGPNARLAREKETHRIEL